MILSKKIQYLLNSSNTIVRTIHKDETNIQTRTNIKYSLIIILFFSQLSNNILLIAFKFII